MNYGVSDTVVGMVLCVVRGYLLFGLLASLFTLDSGPLSVGPSLVVESLLVGIGIPLLAALLPICLGTCITVQQALSGYGLESGSGRGRGQASAIRRIFAFVPQTVQLGMRSLFRRRTRALLTLLALTISAAGFLAGPTPAYAVRQTPTGGFHTYPARVF